MTMAVLAIGPLQFLSQNPTYFLRSGLPEHKHGVCGVFRVADVCDTDRVRRLLFDFSPEVIFHAVAYKHVPIGRPLVRYLVDATSSPTSCAIITRV